MESKIALVKKRPTCKLDQEGWKSNQCGKIPQRERVGRARRKVRGRGRSGGGGSRNGQKGNVLVFRFVI